MAAHIAHHLLDPPLDPRRQVNLGLDLRRPVDERRTLRKEPHQVLVQTVDPGPDLGHRRALAGLTHPISPLRWLPPR